MPRSSFRAAAALGLAASLAFAFTPALDASSAPKVVTAADLGLDYAPKVVRVDAPTREARNEVAALGLDLTEHASHDYVEVVLHTAADEAKLVDAGFVWEVEIADLVLDESQRIMADRAWAAEVGVSDLPSGRTEYRHLEDYHADIDHLVAEYPTLAKRISIGKSVEGLDLAGIEIGRDVDGPEDGRPVFLMFGVHHAREWPSAEMPMEFAFDLLQGYTDPTHDQHERIVDLLDRGRAIIVPVSNPDGFQVSRRFAEDVSTSSLGNAWKRKNCRYVTGVEQPSGTCIAVYSLGQTGVGVDLNRNYGGLWGGPGASSDPTSGTYRGDAPFSEPETQAIRTLISTRQVTTLITNHTRGHLLLRPVGVKPSTVGPDGLPRGFAPDECFTREDGVDYGLQALGERMTAQNGYSNQFGWELYDTTGTTEDYSYNATGGYGYTFELMPSGGSFHPGYSQVVKEYTGADIKAKNLKAVEGTTIGQQEAERTTSPYGDDCEGDHVQHTTLGGGLRESYFIAFENAVDRRTHSLVTGIAPAGAEITVSRTGDFPLWSGETMTDTVETTMVTTEDGVFEYDVNPSTRPFVASRKIPGSKGFVMTPGEKEAWTVTCSVSGETRGTVEVVVDRGHTIDVGDLCA